jgi:hypothetical protein
VKQLIIHPNAVFSIRSLTAALELKASTLSREMRLHRLRYARRGGKTYFVGSWILQWLADGEVTSAEPAANGVNGHRPRSRSSAQR